MFKMIWCSGVGEKGGNTQDSPGSGPGDAVDEEPSLRWGPE